MDTFKVISVGDGTWIIKKNGVKLRDAKVTAIRQNTVESTAAGGQYIPTDQEATIELADGTEISGVKVQGTPKT